MIQMFDSFFMAGFECSSHRRRDGVRLDLIKATSHDKHAFKVYALCIAPWMATLCHIYCRLCRITHQQAYSVV